LVLAPFCVLVFGFWLLVWFGLVFFFFCTCMVYGTYHRPSRPWSDHRTMVGPWSTTSKFLGATIRWRSGTRRRQVS
jgi:hypothetical protein